jgi:hypothetical protein
MRLKIVDRSGRLGNQDQKALERRLLFALTRYAPHIERVHLEFDEQHEAEDGMLRCRGSITMQGDRRVQVDDRDRDGCSCGFRVADRLSRSMARLLDPRSFHHGPKPGPIPGFRDPVTRRGE